MRGNAADSAHVQPGRLPSARPHGQYLDALALELEAHRRAGRRTWCIFDNTASFAAVPNALSLLWRQREGAPGHRPDAPC